MKSKTLKQNKDFRRLYYRGKSEAKPTVVTYAMKNRKGSTYYGITVSKKIGNAVARNRSKRLIREAFASLEDRLTDNYDLIFVARTKTSNVKMQVVQSDLEKELLSLGVIK